MQCPSCGQQNREGAQFCFYCGLSLTTGNKVTSATTVPQQTPLPPQQQFDANNPGPGGIGWQSDDTVEQLSTPAEPQASSPMVLGRGLSRGMVLLCVALLLVLGLSIGSIALVKYYSRPTKSLIIKKATPSLSPTTAPSLSPTTVPPAQTKMINPNTIVFYASLKWTITTVTSSLSVDGKQADTGMRFIVVTLKVDNSSPNDFYASPNDYIRLLSGTTTTLPTSTTLNSSIAADTAGTTGTITFLMSQKSSSFTLVFLASTDGASEVTSSFQI